MPEWSPRGGTHPDLDALAAFVDGAVEEGERRAIESHLASCEECFELVSEMMAVREGAAVTPAPVPNARVLPFYRRKGPLIGIAALATAAAIVLAVRFQLRSPDNPGDARFDRLAAAVAGERPVEARLTGNFSATPFRGVQRSGQAAANYSLFAVAGEFQQAAERAPTADNLHAFGVAQLLLGEYDAAVTTLETAVTESPDSAAALSDLAAALLARGETLERASDYPRALDAAERALRIDRTHAPAAFNKALALEKLNVQDSALAAWRDYLQLDGGSDWAREARERTARLEQQPQSFWTAPRSPDTALEEVRNAARLQPARVRRWLEHDLLGEWARTPSTHQLPPVAEPAARALSAATQDTDPLALVGSAARACASNGEACERWRAAYRAYLEGAGAIEESLFDKGAPLLQAALPDLQALDNPLAAHALLGLARVAYNRGQVTEAERMARGVDAAGRAVLRGERHRLLGVCAFSRGSLEETRTHYQSMRDAFQQAGDADSVASALNMLATFKRYVGDFAASWDDRVAASRLTHAATPPLVRHALLTGMVIAAQAQGVVHAAAVLQKAVVANAVNAHPGALAEALAQLAVANSRIGAAEGVEQDLAAARTALARVADAGLRSRIDVQILTAEAQALTAIAPARAAESARTAIEQVSARGDLLRLSQLHAYLADAEMRRGDRVAAARAVDEGIAIFERERKQLRQEQRITYFDVSWQLFERKLEGLLDDGDLDAAFKLLEVSRARTLRESRRVAAARRLATFQRGLAEHEAALILSQFRDRLALLVIRRDERRLAWSSVSAAEAERLVRRSRHAATAAGAEALLYDAVIRPVADTLRGVTMLHVVPDAPFHHAPFPALRAAGSQRFLIEDMALVVSPGLQWPGRQIDSSSAGARVVIVSVPQPAAPAFAPIPGVRREAETITALYPRVEWLHQEAATPERVLQAFSESEVVHIAAHARANTELPFLSHLALAPSDTNPQGLLYADALEKRDLTGVRVVVLAACDTAEGQVRRGEGVLSLARGVLAAGAASVVATVAPVADVESEQVFVEFHRRLSAGLSVAESMRQAQLAALRSATNSQTWRWMIVAGSGA